MSYLAMSAALIDNDNTPQETSINKKKQHHNKTQKNTQTSSDFNQEKVNSVLQSIHNKPYDEEELANYKSTNTYEFPSNPISMGGERKKQEGMTNIPQPSDNDNLNLYDLQNSFMNESQIKNYYKKMTHNTPSNSYATSNTYSGNDVLIEKLNYMINLLETQQEQKIGNVTEEVVLYSFLGVFVIFIVDSFTKVGKYVR